MHTASPLVYIPKACPLLPQRRQLTDDRLQTNAARLASIECRHFVAECELPLLNSSYWLIVHAAFRLGRVKFPFGLQWRTDVRLHSYRIPFGGFKSSGWGRELGMQGLEAYLETKVRPRIVPEKPLKRLRLSITTTARHWTGPSSSSLCYMRVYKSVAPKS
jgi:hypothetical protein